MERHLRPVDREGYDALAGEKAGHRWATVSDQPSRDRIHRNTQSDVWHPQGKRRSINSRVKLLPTLFYLPLHHRHTPYTGIPARMIPNVTALSAGLVTIALIIIPIDASRKSAGVIG